MVLALMTHYNDPKIGGIRGYFGDFLIKDFVRVVVLEYRSTGLLSNYLINKYLVILSIRVLYVYSLFFSINNQLRSISIYYSLIYSLKVPKAIFDISLYIRTRFG
jgi:hypothetical protein